MTPEDMAKDVEERFQRHGGWAFPHGNREVGGDPGMTLRDYFAAQALVGIYAGRQDGMMVSDTAFESDAKVSYQLADAMLKQRSGE